MQFNFRTLSTGSFPGTKDIFFHKFLNATTQLNNNATTMGNSDFNNGASDYLYPNYPSSRRK